MRPEEPSPVTAAATTTGTKPKLSGSELLDAIVNSLDLDKAEEIVTINLTGKSAFADYMIIASGRSNRQVSALATHLIERLKEWGTRPRAEGMSQGDWVLIDAGDVIVHIFRPEVRDFYNLEKMWSSELVDDTA